MADFFISYNKADKLWGRWIAWILEEEKYTVIFQEWDFPAGSNFVLEMDRAAAGAERTIAVLSPDYLAALYTQSEWAAAFAKDPTGKEGKLLPVRVREFETKGLLHPIVYIDLLKLDEAAAKPALLNGVKRERALAIDEVVYGSEHPDVAIDINNLGLVLQEQEDIDGAKVLFERSLKIFREFLSDDHPYTRGAQDNLILLEKKLENAGQ